MRRMVLTIFIVGMVIMLLGGTASAQKTGNVKESINYFQWFVWPGGGVIGIVLILLNFASIAIIINYFVTIRRTTLLPELVQQQINEMVANKQFRDILDFTEKDPSFLSYVVHRALSEAPRGLSAMELAIEEAAEERATNLLRKVEVLNVIGNVSPMLGLLGTVYGMIRAFSKIVQVHGMPPADQLAESIGIALVTTFWGLVVAIPALTVYAVMRNRIDSLSSEAIALGQATISSFRPGVKKSTKPSQKEAKPSQQGSATDTSSQQNKAE